MNERLEVIIIMLAAIMGMMFVGLITPDPVAPPVVVPVQEPMPVFPPKQPEPYSETFGIDVDLAAKIIFYSDKHGVDTDVAFGLVEVESGFNRYAISKTGARGLTQLLRSTAGDYVPNPTDSLLFDVDANLDLGMFYMRKMLDRFDDTAVALTAYNAGPNKIARMIRDGRKLPTYYSRTVLAVAERMGD